MITKWKSSQRIVTSTKSIICINKVDRYIDQYSKWASNHKVKSLTASIRSCFSMRSLREREHRPVTSEADINDLGLRDSCTLAKPYVNSNDYVAMYQQQINGTDFQYKEKKAVKDQSMYSFLQNRETKLMNRFINFLSKKGKKAKAQNIFYNSLKILLTIITKEKMGKTLIGQSGELRSNTSLIKQIDKVNSYNSEESKIFHIFDEAILNIQPLFEVKKVRIAGTTYQVPALISQKRQENKAMNWLIESTLERKKKGTSQSFEYCLAFEIYEAFLKQGHARQKRNELHKLAESNRAFSHFRWW